MTIEPPSDASWAQLSQLEPEQREQAMRARFADLAAASAPARVLEAEAMVRAEYALEDDALHPFTVSRLRAWIDLSQADPDQVQAVVAAYDHVFATLPADIAMKRASVVQTVAREQLTSDEIEALFDLIPSLVRQLPRASQDAARSAASQSRVEEARQEHAGSRKPFWKFW